jgi:hypothetical protein
LFHSNLKQVGLHQTHLSASSGFPVFDPVFELICSNRQSLTGRDLRSGQALPAYCEQNLNSGLVNGIDAGAGECLNRRFMLLWLGFYAVGEMRTPRGKSASSKSA